jgi:hypothetical protein
MGYSVPDCSLVAFTRSAPASSRLDAKKADSTVSVCVVIRGDPIQESLLREVRTCQSGMEIV